VYYYAVESGFLNDLRILIRTRANRRLPSIRTLAARWKCSPTTVQAVLGKARARGWIETRAGAGSWPAGRMPGPVAHLPRPTSESLAADLKEEIRSGRWGGGERLPPPKDLATRYGVHPATVRKALGRLAADSVLEQQGHAWRVARPRRHATEKLVLLCLGAKEREGSLRLGSDREWDFWREIQIEATRNNLRPEIHPWSGKLPDLGNRPIGAVVSTWHLPDPYPLLSALHRVRLPSAVWLENPVLSPARLPMRSPWLGFHDMAYGQESGTALGTHPAIRKHARIAWISPFHGAEWSRNRLEGLRRSLPKGTLLHEALGPWVSEWDFQEKVWHDPQVWKHLRLEGLVRAGNTGDLVRPLMESIGRDRLFDRFAPSLKAALSSGSTLWVAASDWVAMGCMDWLRAKGMRVPEDIALAGFDDSREALRHGLTSVRFDAQMMARAMVRQLLSSETGRPRAIHYEGTVLARGSTP
jgi:DNA-binding transcriptional regulator YhcF (GntR family)